MLSRLYNWYGKKVVWGAIVVVIVLVAAGIFLSQSGGTQSEADSAVRSVKTASIQALSSENSVELIGEVESANSAAIESETSGRVVSVSVSLGQKVTPGQVIGQLENASERAAVLQAEGVYEAALAASAQSNSNQTSAETALSAALDSGRNTYRSAFITIDSTMRNSIDLLFSDPSGSIPGFKLDSLGQATTLNTERTALETVLNQWANSVSNHPSDDALKSKLREADLSILRISTFVETLAQIAAKNENNGAVVDGQSIETIRANLASARSDINTTRQSVESAIVSIENAEESLARAQIAGTSGDISSANAQVKQALGALRGAQAALERTIFRTPIAGTVNQLYIDTGDYLSTFAPVAQVANNNALEITAYVTESERNRLAVGSPVRISNKYDGVITNIAPAVDPLTKKVEVHIGTEATELTNGDTVRIALTGTQSELSEIRIPITALKVETDRIVVFTVLSDSTLEAHPVMEGPIVGNTIVIKEGLTPDMVIVLDARGLNEGDSVLITE